MSGVHGFLHRYFRVCERQRAPRVASMEAEPMGSFVEALSAQDWRIWSLVTMGRVQRDPRWTELHAIVVGAYYLHLAIEHVPVLEAEVVALVEKQYLPESLDEVEEAETLGTMVSWPKLAEMAFGSNTPKTRREARALLVEGIRIVGDAIVDREIAA